MTDQSPNDIFRASSFLQGHNAEYIEHLYARYANDPNAVDAAWQQFFRELGDPGADAKAEAAGPSWARADWPPAPSDELTSALDGQWGDLGPAAQGAAADIQLAGDHFHVRQPAGSAQQAITNLSGQAAAHLPLGQ